MAFSLLSLEFITFAFLYVTFVFVVTKFATIATGDGTEAVAAGSPYRYPLWLARALNSAIYDVKWDYESDRAIARIADFYIKIALFIINLCCCAPFCKYT